jgi:hypothetical protein
MTATAGRLLRCQWQSWYMQVTASIRTCHAYAAEEEAAATTLQFVLPKRAGAAPPAGRGSVWPGVRWRWRTLACACADEAEPPRVATSWHLPRIQAPSCWRQ